MDTDKVVKMAAPRSLYFAIFAISGFSGLVYESIWSHYLKLFLGHAAYAQSLVLIIFMGGMALGSWVASRMSSRTRSPILIYAAVEVVVGLAALVFHPVFTGLIDVTHASVLPAISSPVGGVVFKWLAAGLLILPQSVLLGMTFPLMSAGIIRRFPDTPGGSIAMLYFTNSIGAALGVLASGFWFIGLFGLPGTIFTAGLLNIALALVVWILVRLDPHPETEPLAAESRAQSTGSLRGLFLVAAFITGMASFIYEISWIRMLSLVLGATTHSFELMLSAFITGLAFGGLWIKRRIDRVGDPVRFSGYVQLIMGVFALLTIPVYVFSFGWMSWLLGALSPTDSGFTAFTLSSHIIALAVMLPTTFMAGMTLPLFTYVLLRKGEGESSIGQIYAANTVGAIVGVLFAVHIGLPALGLKGLIVFGAALDIALAMVLLNRTSSVDAGRIQRLAGVGIGIGAIAVTLLFTSIDKGLLVSGVYRYGNIQFAAEDEILFYKDGKTASVSLRRTPGGVITLATNGKPDASIEPDLEKPPTPDEITMTLAGTIPLAYLPTASRIANIGMGSGQTTHVLLANPDIEVVDTIEIERQMVEASKGFGDAVSRAHQDPRSRIFIEDAKTYFSMHDKTYDIIIAEPSNPWVSGVASLFSREFYSTVLRYLDDDGLFVQWIQLYEFTDALSESILKALAANFSDYAVYTTDGSNMLFVATKTGDLAEPDWNILFSTDQKIGLERVGIHSAADLIVRKITERDSLSPFLSLSAVPLNSDYYPFVDLNAGKARYLRATAKVLNEWMSAPLPLLEMLNADSIEYSRLNGDDGLTRSFSARVARRLHSRLVRRDEDAEGTPERQSVGRLEYAVRWFTVARDTCVPRLDADAARVTLHELAYVSLPYLESPQAQELVSAFFPSDCEVLAEIGDAGWRQLYDSVAARDAVRMSLSSRQLLRQADDLSESERTYLLGVAMLGDISQEKAGAAFEIWEETGPEMFRGDSIPEHLRLLLGIAVTGMNAETPVAMR